ncbi:UDP-N-acetylmuramoyl-tripeptide--D-alanyl-D-alanine ligase [Saccharobesus litoralis]|uniref:UDP-N-acetylmuramoyl-tripeptide--D-alanyl-D-alanine ligase n=1 Tax=Saccharobesus litoralis TaxID=2172099 RepID=A0A2S0VWZ6_9ALTE|nr:UDP-N-acetylmuramoyl-tripeptide--D-alanyl-D-alanine ligase [Saccharobesus litoralis]AWB68744.1 UDP-N-acetylmuramoyl-tripeptide--D-alanyl-D-alanine ligase [Saccharobesus litoralis]
MINLSLLAIAEMTSGQLKGSDHQIHQVSTDTRRIETGSLFVALKGERFDAHAFIEQAVSAGASAVVVEHEVDADVAQIIVDDTRVALGKIAKGVKALCDVKTIAITGSCGKTTVKELLQSICQLAGNTLATKGNLNNDIGVPLTLLELTAEHEYAVVELGANHIGEIAYSVDLVKPDVALVNNVSGAHLEGFGSLSGVAQAKGEIYSGLSESGKAVVNYDCEFKQQWQSRLAQLNVTLFSLQNEQADLYASNMSMNAFASQFELNFQGQGYAINLQLPGAHNIANALAAASCALAAGIDIQTVVSGLNKNVSVKGRLNRIQITDNLIMIDDTYNANKASMQAALDVLANVEGRKIFVMGDMAELGNYARKEHQDVGNYARSLGIQDLFTFGEMSLQAQEGHDSKQHFHQLETLVTALKASLDNQPTTILVKGSRSARMERVIEAMKSSGVAEC